MKYNRKIIAWNNFLNRYVILLFVIQVMGYIIVIALFDHSPTPLVGWIQALPDPVRIVLLPVGFFALPAVVLSLVIGAVLSVVGHPPESISAVLVTQGDVLVFGSAYCLAIVGAWGVRNYKMRNK
jgi:hypothetical protein